MKMRTETIIDFDNTPDEADARNALHDALLARGYDVSVLVTREHYHVCLRTDASTHAVEELLPASPK